MHSSLSFVQAFLEWTVQKASSMSSPPRRRKKNSNSKNFPSPPIDGGRPTSMTRQLVDENDENFSSTRYSQKPKRRLFFDSNEWEDARTNVEKEEKNANIDSEESAAHRNRCLEQKTRPRRGVAFAQRSK